jgi:hypothetical protein
MDLATKCRAVNPRTSDDARAFVKHVESFFIPRGVRGIVAGFTEDCIVRFGGLLEFRGAAALEKFFNARSARHKGYLLRKEFRPDARYHRKLLGRCMGGRTDWRENDRPRRGYLEDARRQDRSLGSRLQRA